MNTNEARFDGVQEPVFRNSSAMSVLVFVISSIVLFFGMSNIPSTYDEGITLTGAMRVAAGQIPHRDFHANYGPLHFYLLAWLFKAFGESLLVERIYYAALCGLVVAVCFAIASRYCSKSMVFWSTAMIGLWLFGLGAVSGSVIIPVSAVNMVGVVILAPAFLRPISFRRGTVAGLLAGLSSLLRYDTGVAFIGVQICVIAFASYLQASPLSSRLKLFVRSSWPILAGFAAVVLPAVIYYKSRASFHDFNVDVIEYAWKYYNRGRALPFPAPHLKYLSDIEVYLLIVIAAMALYVGVTGSLRPSVAEDDSAPVRRNRLTCGLLFIFGLLGAVMYLKGLVRVGVAGMYLSLVPSLISFAILYDRRYSYRPSVTLLLRCLMFLSVFAASFSAAAQVYRYHKLHSWVVSSMIADARGKLPPEEEAWCKTPSPLTRGICFAPDIDHIRTIEFIESHTTPDQTLFLGLPHHDRVIQNDVLTYFATQRAPVTHWYHFDPFLQNTKDVQLVMIQEFKRNKPPYIVIDSEYENVHEPNESDKSTGVTLLDDYLHAAYRPVVTFGAQSIWQQTQP